MPCEYFNRPCPAIDALRLQVAELDEVRQTLYLAGAKVEKERDHYRQALEKIAKADENNGYARILIARKALALSPRTLEILQELEGTDE